MRAAGCWAQLCMLGAAAAVLLAIACATSFTHLGLPPLPCSVHRSERQPPLSGAATALASGQRPRRQQKQQQQQRQQQQLGSSSS